MRKLSIFADESGNFGRYNPQNPYYIVSLVFHDQSAGISDNIARLNEQSSSFNIPSHNIHTAPLIRREGVYSHTEMEERRWLFNQLFHFFRQPQLQSL